MVKLLSAVLILALTFPTISLGSGKYINQIQTIVLFYETMLQNKPPTVSDFLKLFGKDNEAELEVILRQKFPTLDWKKNWSDNEEAVDYIEKVFNNPQNHTSMFLQCIKLAEPTFFAGVKWQIEFPPEITKDFRKFSVLIRAKRIIIEFSQDERTIENVYLPDGKSIYSLIEGCVNRTRR